MVISTIPTERGIAIGSVEFDVKVGSDITRAEAKVFLLVW